MCIYVCVCVCVCVKPTSSPQVGEEGRDEEGSLYQLGLHLLHTLHAMAQLDALALLAASHNTDYSQAAGHFNTLLSCVLTPAGRHAVVALLGLDGHLEVLFSYLRLGAGDDQDNAPTRLGCYGYAVELVVMAVKLCERVEAVERCGAALLQLVEYEEAREGPKLEEHARLCEVLPWLAPARPQEAVPSYDNLAALSAGLKDQLEKIDKFSGELVTQLRLIRRLSVPDEAVSALAPEEHNGELIDELKYRYATVQLFSADCHTHITNLLTKLCTMYAQPAVHASSLAGSEGAVLLAMIRPALAILKNILTYVIQARNTSFKDLSAVVPLVQTFLLLQAFPPGSQHGGAASQLQRQVVATLLLYTQPRQTAAEGEGVLAKRLWTKMMAEVTLLYTSLMYSR